MTVLPIEDAGLAGLNLLDGLATPLWLVRPDGETVWLNRAARSLLDLPAPAPSGPSPPDPAPPSSLPAGALRAEPSGTAAGALKAAAAGRRVEANLVFHAEGGPPVEVEAWLSPAPRSVSPMLSSTLSPAPPLILVEASADSVARREVMRLTEQLVALSYAYPDMRFELRGDGTILDFAAAAPSDLNVPAERFLNQRVQDVLPEPAAGLIAAALRRLRDGEAVAGVEFALPGPSSRDGAGKPDADKAFEARLVALLDGDRVLCSVRNVTERVRAERDARRAHERLLDAIECIAEGFVLYDAQDRLVLCNSRYRELFSANADLTAPGTRFETVLREGAKRGLYGIPPADLDGWIERRIALHTGGGAPMEVPLSDGRWIRIEEWRTQEGGTVGIRADITDLKAREAELSTARDEAERANRRKSDYVHHLSHELRTPLNAVMGFAQILGDELMGPIGNPRYRDYARQIASAGVYMLDLINNLLDLAKIEAGRMDLNEESCNLALLVDLTFGMMLPRAGDAAVTLKADIPDDLPGVLGDASLIRQMLTNLIGNAIKFARPPEGRVLVRAGRTVEGGIVLSVSDNGMGMSAEQIPVALDAFGQVHERGLAGERGSGLGLPLTRALIALHGGRLDIESTIGVGTTVRLGFPPERVGAEAGIP